jgi:hypothetical protein
MRNSDRKMSPRKQARNNFSYIEIRQLVQFVKSNPILWNYECAGYNNPIAKANVWKEIARKFPGRDGN